MVKIVSSPSKAPAAVASHIVIMMGALNDCEGINLGETASTADRALPVDTKSVYIKVSAASRNQLFRMDMVGCAIDH
jgi:hypothetical protein